ncbi:c-type cytochrome [Solemya velesiana gill symbiont]|nr:c-type cytochrome [Solemya velesiana gill symbiont]
MELRKRLEARIEQIEMDKDGLEKMKKAGRERTVLCKTCHGDDGIAVKELVPNLAGQNPVYLVDQFKRFGDGQRNDFFMSALAKSFSEENKIKIALYYSSMEMKASGGGKLGLMTQGRNLYKETCSRCHGADGKGQEGYVRLAGQRYDYVAKMLKEFCDRTGRRTNPWMSGVALKLNDEDMEAVATYLASLK